MKTFLVPLTPEEETDCLCRLKNGEQGAKEELVLHNMRLVAHVAKKYVSSEEEQEDLISIGTIGLMKAVDSFRPEYGNKIAPYAIRCVDNELLMHLRSKKKQRKEVSMFEPIGTDKEGNQIQLVDQSLQDRKFGHCHLEQHKDHNQDQTNCHTKDPCHGRICVQYLNHTTNTKNRRVQNDSKQHGHYLLHLLDIIGTSCDQGSG